MERRLTAEQLQVLPELAILTTLGDVLQVAITALLAAHPELSEAEPNPLLSSPPSAALCAADSLVNLADVMKDAIDCYRRATFHMINFVPRAGEASINF